MGVGVLAILGNDLKGEFLHEKRAATRYNVLGAATIEFDGGEINCVVRDMSISGAALEVSNPLSVPDRFTLAFRADGLRRMPCHVVWLKQRRMGAAFD